MTLLQLSPYIVVGLVIAAAAILVIRGLLRLMRGETGCASCASSGTNGSDAASSPEIKPFAACSGCSGCPSARQCASFKPVEAKRTTHSGSHTPKNTPVSGDQAVRKP